MLRSGRGIALPFRFHAGQSGSLSMAGEWLAIFLMYANALSFLMFD